MTKTILQKYDPCMTLLEWKFFIDKLIGEYGENAILYTTTGIFNSVSLEVEDESTEDI